MALEAMVLMEKGELKRDEVVWLYIVNETASFN